MNPSASIAAIPEKFAAQRQVMRENAERQLAKGTDAQKAAARALLDALNGHEQAERTALASRMAATPLAARVAEAFRLDPPTETEEAVLRVLLDHPGSTSAALSRACGWGGQSLIRPH